MKRKQKKRSERLNEKRNGKRKHCDRNRETKRRNRVGGLELEDVVVALTAAAVIVVLAEVEVAVAAAKVIADHRPQGRFRHPLPTQVTSLLLVVVQGHHLIAAVHRGRHRRDPAKENQKVILGEVMIEIAGALGRTNL